MVLGDRLHPLPAVRGDASPQRGESQGHDVRHQHLRLARRRRGAHQLRRRGLRVQVRSPKKLIYYLYWFQETLSCVIKLFRCVKFANGNKPLPSSRMQSGAASHEYKPVSASNGGSIVLEFSDEEDDEDDLDLGVIS